jgi:hypothetical protein
MDILEIVRTDLKGGTVKRQREVAAACGMAWSTLRRIVDGSGCHHATAEKLRGYYATQNPALDRRTGDDRRQQSASNDRRGKQQA